MYLPFKETAARMGLEISESKTKKMLLSRNNQQQQQQNLVDIENVREFRYLGSMVTARNEMEREVLARITAGNRCYYSLQHLLKRRNITRPTKLRIYNTIIRPVVLYGCETWTLTKHLEQRLLVFENNILRRISGPIYDINEGVWRRRHNEELRALTRQPLITDHVRSQRIQWAGHVARMEEDRMPKSAMEGTMEGRRPVGRPRMRWRDN